MSVKSTKNLIIILFLILNTNLFCQNYKLIDSLKVSIPLTSSTKNLVNNYFLLVQEYQKFDTKKSIEINNKIWELSKKNN